MKSSRREKVKQLMESWQSLKRHMAFGMKASSDAPRVTPSQWSVLMCIEDGSVKTVKDVAQALKITSSAATQLIDGLAKSGYVVRSQSTDDRRTVLLSLSKKTNAHIGKMKREVLQKFVTIFDTLTDSEFEQYAALNNKIVQTLTAKK